MKRARYSLLFAVLAGVSSAQNLQNREFTDWDNDSVPSYWTPESPTRARISAESEWVVSAPLSCRITRLVDSTGNNNGIRQFLTVTGGSEYVLGAWLLTPTMPDTMQYVRGGMFVTWYKLSGSDTVYISSSYPVYVRSSTWQRIDTVVRAPDSATIAKVAVRCYGRADPKSIAGGVVIADNVSGLLAVEEERARAIQPGFDVAPNPFAGTTLFCYAGAEVGPVRFVVFDATGQAVRTLEGAVSSGLHLAQWDGTNDAGDELPDGVYFARVEPAADRTSVRKVMILR